MREAVELPLTHFDLYQQIGIDPPRGVLMYGPPGTGKTMLAKAVANATTAAFISVVGSEFVQKYLGEVGCSPSLCPHSLSPSAVPSGGALPSFTRSVVALLRRVFVGGGASRLRECLAVVLVQGPRMVRDVFRLARENAPAIIFIDEVDAIGTKRFDSQTGADREVQRILLELLTQMDGFDQHTNVKVIMATNRQDTLDPALLRPGRLDRKVGGRAVWLMVLEKLWVSFVAESE
jgi:26S proteasome regulatory subunit T3